MGRLCQSSSGLPVKRQLPGSIRTSLTMKSVAALAALAAVLLLSAVPVAAVDPSPSPSPAVPVPPGPPDWGPLAPTTDAGSGAHPAPPPLRTRAPRVGRNAALPGCRAGLAVLIAYADTGVPADLKAQIEAEPGVTVVDLFDAAAGTPTLAQLEGYNVVVPFSNSGLQDATALGNNLADYVDEGGTVVQYGFSFYGPSQPYGVNGRWLTGNYNPYDYSINLSFAAFTLGTYTAAHPIMAGVTTLSSTHQNVVTPASGATQVAAASNGNSLVAFRPVSEGAS